MQAKVEIITPGFAKQLLELNPTNRPLSDHTVQRYARDMRGGRWQPNGQGIILTADGKLLDGQHRLAAIISSGETIGVIILAVPTSGTAEDSNP